MRRAQVELVGAGVAGAVVVALAAIVPAVVLAGAFDLDRGTVLLCASAVALVAVGLLAAVVTRLWREQAVRGWPGRRPVDLRSLWADRRG